MHRKRGPGIWPGFILVLLGAGLLAREFGLVPHHVRVVDFWPLFVMVMGVSSLSRGRGFVAGIFALAFVVMGGLLLAGNLGMIAFPAARLWPALLVLLGLSFIVRGRHRQGFREHWRYHRRFGDDTSLTRTDPSGGGDGGGNGDGSGPGGIPKSDEHFHQHHSQTTDADELHRQYTFSGAQLNIESQAWRGGELGVTAGGVEVDFRNARLAPEGAVLDLRVVMGGVDIRVPPTWKVSCDVTPLFGGADDMTRTTQGSGDAPRLRLTGTVTLGGVTVRH